MILKSDNERHSYGPDKLVPPASQPASQPARIPQSNNQFFPSENLVKNYPACKGLMDKVSAWRSGGHRFDPHSGELSLDVPQSHQVLVVGPGNGLESVSISLRLLMQLSYHK
ncbi:hypothetical protein DPMN_087347 [Dreissena polymorpha]|uniref:Uncharacterized protein n=1 Tax=Dreissena polymorpha TaxID=45954 RepID=A0A9D4KS81_DREPO|nr:hypothetical protein DPMN_087347 [Dreissena polymorpha]